MATHLETFQTMKRGKLILMATIVCELIGLGPAAARQQTPAATFRSGVDLVRVTAVVRDHKGRFVQNLSARDFVISEGGETRPITDFRNDVAGISVALLFDVSGSMEAQFVNAREAATQLLAGLDLSRDEAAIFTFDTHLDQVMPFTTGLQALPETLSSVKPFGATSLHDAIAATARRAATRDERRRAVVVFSDGRDNWSHMTPGDVSGIASSIDVPVYILGIVPAIDNPSENVSSAAAGRSALNGALSDLATWTGGHTFIVSSPAQRGVAARQILEELRHQYLLAFESSGQAGWHALEIRARDKALTVRARSGYIAGQSRPTSE